MRPGVVNAFYFSVAPSLFGDLAERLHAHGIAMPESRIVVEKPFGRDLSSARALNATLAEHFDRTARSTGSTTIWARDGPEPDGGPLRQYPVRTACGRPNTSTMSRSPWPKPWASSGRGAYYDKSGAMRDMVQNHMMQLLCLIAMEPPYHFDPDAVRDEKLKVIRALDPVKPEDIVRGQYGPVAGSPGYLEHAENPARAPKAISR
jgi:glucose-6-phosphate 1-dehydrogenase